ncbi:hypothetical protein RQP54_03290 [Curvibacter sp. APW13]|uniref:hypothetical protein n=1 Tax=Curvibacter sp. APW13 TaxID=3077236 RepID=UPI0028DEE28C|nr:hypothetical protein [Curvibacter sp. APW13]MDT8989879.1 hypothetical protein [Curvibacter sp. APW13]
MSTNRPPPGSPATMPGYDPLLDPIPQPAVKERDTDTAWAEFDSLMSEDPADAEPPHPDFEETQPFDRDAPV